MQSRDLCAVFQTPVTAPGKRPAARRPRLFVKVAESARLPLYQKYPLVYGDSLELIALLEEVVDEEAGLDVVEKICIRALECVVQVFFE